MAFSLSLPASQCVVPDTLTGPVAVWITSDDQPLNNNARDRTNLTPVAGPAMFFIDNEPQAISQLVRATGANSTVVSTVTPDEASSILASASAATATATAAVAAFTPDISEVPAPWLTSSAATAVATASAFASDSAAASAVTAAADAAAASAVTSVAVSAAAAGAPVISTVPIPTAA